MCVLCGLKEIKGHWTDAGIPTTRQRVRMRLERAKKIQEILNRYQLSLYDDGLSPEFQISNLFGRVELVMNLEELWKVAEDLSGRPIDPLDKNFHLNSV